MEYFTKTTLKERNWTEGLIKKFLGKPDLLKKNPRFSSAAPMCMWLEEKVIEIEKSERFEKSIGKLKKRRETTSKLSRERHDKYRRDLLSYITDLKIELPHFSKAELLKRSCEHWESRGDYEKEASLDSDPSFLNRISVNFLRHECTIYEDELEKLFGQTGKDEAYVLLKEKILKKIWECYPFLKSF